MDKQEKPQKRKIQWSKLLCFLGAAMGFIVVQECLFLMYLMIKAEFSASAAWLTASVGVGEAVIALCVQGYLSLCKVDHSKVGITYAKAEAKGFAIDDDVTPI